MAKESEAAPGSRFGRLVVVKLLDGPGRRMVVCACDCGSVTTRRLSSLGVRASSCVCPRPLSRGSEKSKARAVWRSMMSRCSNPLDKDWRHYGGRGIHVCDRWSGAGGFDNFYGDMWPRPTPGHTVDRVDNEKGYGPENCRWATRTEQGRNRRTTKLNHDILRAIVVGEFSSMTAKQAANAIGSTESAVASARSGRSWPGVAEALRREA